MLDLGIMQGRLTPSNGRGIQFFPFEHWKQEFHIASKIGLNEIEFIFDLEKYSSNPLWDDTGIAELRSLISETGISVHSLCFDYFMRRPFYKASGFQQEELRKENKAFLLQMFHAVDLIGGSLIEIPSVDASSLKTDAEKELYAAFLKEMDEETETKYPHIKIGLETDLPADEFARFIDSLNSSRIGANYDSGNSSGLGYDLYEEVTTLGTRILNVHIKDRVYQGTTVALGTGSADFEGLFKGLGEIGYNKSFILQAARGLDGDEAETIRSQCDFVKEYIVAYGLN